MKKRSTSLGSGLVALLLWAPAHAFAETADPMQVIERLHAVLIDVMKESDVLGYEGRSERLGPVLQEAFDLPFMAQKSVGRHWKTASEQDRERLVATFRRFTIANYAGRFNGFSGQRFETLRHEPSLRETVIVYTRLLIPDDEEVQLNYRLRQVKGSWKIIDVYLNGTVSELALRRSEYSAMIQKDGFDALLAALDEKIATLASSPADHS